MKRSIAICLVTLELLLSGILLAGALVFTVLVPRRFPVADCRMLQALLTQYATALDAQRDNWDRLGTRVVASYAVNFRELGALSLETGELVGALRETLAVPVPGFLGNLSLKPAEDLKRVSRDLEVLLGRLSRTMDQTAQVFSDYSQEDHQKFLAAVDSTILLLQLYAQRAGQAAATGPRLLRNAGLAVSLLALLLFCLSLNQALNLPPPRRD